jgi:hypothetical protein
MINILKIFLNPIFLIVLMSSFSKGDNPVQGDISNNQIAKKGSEIPRVREKFYLYLLIGQSNMSGRGAVEAGDTVGNQRILSLNKNGEWIIAKDPLHFDKAKTGVGPGLSFARAMLNNLPSDVKIGLIPCACGGSPIRVWAPGQFWQQTNSYPYDDAVSRTKLALRNGTLKGILWHQGESDKKPASVAVYKSNLKRLVSALRDEFEAPEVPFIAGEIGAFRKNNDLLNNVLHEAKADITFYDVISATGLMHKGDSTHFDTPSQYILGQRYADKMRQLSK